MRRHGGLRYTSLLLALLPPHIRLQPLLASVRAPANAVEETVPLRWTGVCSSSLYEFAVAGHDRPPLVGASRNMLMQLLADLEPAEGLIVHIRHKVFERGRTKLELLNSIAQGFFRNTEQPCRFGSIPLHKD